MNKPFLFKRVWSLFTCDLCTQCWGEGTVSLWHHLLEALLMACLWRPLLYVSQKPHWSCPVVRSPTTSVRCSMLGADTYYTLLTAVGPCSQMMLIRYLTVSTWCHRIPATDCPQIALLIYILMLDEQTETAIKCFAAKRLKKSRNPAACLFLPDAHLPTVYTELRNEAVSEDLIGQWTVNPFLHLLICHSRRLAKVTC